MKSHEILMRQQKEQINRIEQLQNEILKTSKDPPQKKYIYNEPTSQTEFEDLKATATLEKSSEMYEKINAQTSMLNQSIENIDES